MRNTEIGGIIGRSQLKRLDENNGKRKQNQNVFLSHLDIKLFRVEFDLDGSCNYAFNVILRKADLVLRDRVESAMEKAGVEYRRGSSGGGNQLRQPYLKGIVKEGEWLEFPEVEHVHFFGWYIGNYPSLEIEKINNLIELIN